MAKKKKKEYKVPDLVDYANLGFNPYVGTTETYDRLDDEFDIATIDHRKRAARWKERDKARAAMAKQLGVETVVRLTPANEILEHLPQ